MIDPAEFERGIALLASTFPQSRVDGPLSLAYYRVLSPDLSTAEFVAAVGRVMATERFWPSPAVILAAAGKSRAASVGESATRLEAQAAFGALRSIAEKTIHGPSWRADRIAPELGDCALSAFRAIGGQARLRELAAADEHWARKDFITAYEDAARVRAAGLPLPTPDDVRRIGPANTSKPTLIAAIVTVPQESQQ